MLRHQNNQVEDIIICALEDVFTDNKIFVASISTNSLKNIDLLKICNISAVLFCKKGMQISRNASIQHQTKQMDLYIDVIKQIEIKEYVETAFDFIETNIKSTNVLIASQRDVGLSSSMAITYVMKKYKLRLFQSYKLISKTDPRIKIKSLYLQQLNALNYSLNGYFDQEISNMCKKSGKITKNLSPRMIIQFKTPQKNKIASCQSQRQLNTNIKSEQQIIIKKEVSENDIKRKTQLNQIADNLKQQQKNIENRINTLMEAIKMKKAQNSSRSTFLQEKLDSLRKKSVKKAYGKIISNKQHKNNISSLTQTS